MPFILKKSSFDTLPSQAKIFPLLIPTLFATNILLPSIEIIPGPPLAKVVSALPKSIVVHSSEVTPDNAPAFNVAVPSVIPLV